MEKIVPVQIRLPVELVNTIAEYLQEKGTQAVQILLYKKTIPTIECNSLVHTIDEICAEVSDENGKANGILRRQVRSIVKEMLAESRQK